MSPAVAFQKEYGAEWKEIIRSQPFLAAMQILNIEAVDMVIALTPEQIAEHSREILGGLQAHFKHENDLVTLLDRKETDLTELPPETYEQDKP